MKAGSRLQSVQSPIVPEVFNLIRQHPGTLSLGQGVVWYGPPEQAFELASREMTKSQNQLYGPVEGNQTLLNAITEKLLKDNHISVSDDTSLLVTAGANMAFLNAIMAIADPGDEIILLSPYYFNHEMTISMLGCKVVSVVTDERYHPDISRLESAITDDTRAIVTVSPNNPTGAVYSREELRTINDLCRRYGLFHISDEAYEYFTYDEHSHYSVASDDKAASHTISLFSLSKSYGFAGWRIGYMLVPNQLLGSIKKIQDCNLICASIPAQFAAQGALETGKSYCLERQHVINKNRTLAIDTLSGLDCLDSNIIAEGAFYLFLTLDTEKPAMTICQQLIRDYAVAVIPGEPFGFNNRTAIRVSYGALESEQYELAMGNLAKGLTQIT